MKVKLLRSGEVAEFHDTYGARLIEQGRAVAVMDEPAKAAEELFMPKPELPADEPEQEEKPEKAGTKKKQKG